MHGFHLQIAQIIDNSRDFISDSEERRCGIPIEYFCNEEHKLLAAGEHSKVENDILMKCFGRLMGLYDHFVEDLPRSMQLVAKEARFLYLGAFEIWRDEARIMTNNGIYKIQKLNSFIRLLVTIKWAYFPGDMLTLKYNKRLE